MIFILRASDRSRLLLRIARAVDRLIDGGVLRPHLLGGLEREVPDALVNHRHLNEQGR
jgi:hypothetical protein